MRKKFVALRYTAITAIILGLLLLVWAFFAPSYKEVSTDCPVAEEVFISGALDHIAVIYCDVTEAGHLLGEPFTLEFAIQYKPNKINLMLDSPKDISFYPFEIRKMNVEHKELSTNVSTYLYKVELVAVRLPTLPAGQTYSVDPILINYSVIATGAVNRIDLAPPMKFRVGQKYAGNTKGVNLRPPWEQLEGAAATAKKIAGGMSVLFSIALVSFIAFWSLQIRTKDEAVVNKNKIKRELNRRFYAVRNGVYTDAKSALRELEDIGKEAAMLDMDTADPMEFWNWESLTNERGMLVSKLLITYQEKPPVKQDVLDTIQLMQTVFRETLRKQSFLVRLVRAVRK